MKNLAITFLFVLILTLNGVAQSKCVQNAKVVKPTISEKARKIYDEKLFEAENNFKKSPADADAIIWLGRRNAYLGDYKRAINIYTDGLANHPNDARLYRHRGHRLITLRCFDDAIRDFKKAAKLVRGKADVIEPDGLPNARNIPTSTLQSNIWYHLGLAYYLKGEFKNALRAYDKALKVSQNPDMLVATTNWHYVTLKRLGKDKQARKSIKTIKDSLDIIENDSYYKLIKLYQGKLKAEELLKEIGSDTDNLSNASMAYGLGNYFLINGDRVKAREIFTRLTNGNQWSSFGYIAAEAELRR
jgi:tetratricopeptide (TPR) repeat protein